MDILDVSALSAEALTVAELETFELGTGPSGGGGGGSGLTYLSVSSDPGGSGGEVDHPSTPEAYSIGDLMLFFYGGRSGGGVTFVDYTPTLADGQQYAGQAEGFARYRTAADVVTSETVTYSFSRSKGWIVVTLAGASLDGALDAGQGSVTTHTCPDLTTIANGCRIFRFIGINAEAAQTFTAYPLGDIVEELAVTQGRVCLVDGGIQGSAGATGTADFTTSAGTYSVTITLAVAPS